MSSILERLANAPEDERARLGVEHTPSEILQQPKMWADTVERVFDRSDEFRSLLRNTTSGSGLASGRVVMAGAGTSDFVGRCLEGLWRERLGIETHTHATTDIVSHPRQCFLPDRPNLLVSFARSGNSPESVGATDIADEMFPQVRHLVVTCNDAGELAQRAHTNPDRYTLLVLNEATNDRGLAMTSSFSSMVVAGQALAMLHAESEYRDVNHNLVEAARCVLGTAPDALEPPAKRGFTRACFLGAGSLYGAAIESHLKLQEMTDGRVLCLYDSFLGLRHGPRAALRDDALIVAFVSSDPYARLYEEDLLRENRAKGVGGSTVVVIDRKPDGWDELADVFIEFSPGGEHDIPDAFRPPLDAIVGQTLGLLTSMNLGCRPDAPSDSGSIHRVVQGVRIHPRPGS